MKAPFLEPKDRLIEDYNQNLLFILTYNNKKEFNEWIWTDLENKSLIEPYMPFHIHIGRTGKKYAEGKNKTKMHHIIIGRKAPKGFKIDHANSNGLDNRRCNLRITTDGGNNHNRIKSKNTSSEYSGVSKTSYNKWRSYISFEGKKYHLGEYDDIFDAVKIRDIYAVFFYKECAKLNIKDEGDFFLTGEEINDIYTKGLPEKYQRIKRGEDRELPQCIYKQECSWYYDKTYDYVNYRKSYNTLEEAIEGLNILVKEMEEKEQQKRLEIENNIIRNSRGIAVLYTYDREGDKNGEWLVDDDVWKACIHYSWSRTRDYAQSCINGVWIQLHVHVYKSFMGIVPEGTIVDHIKSDAKNDTRRSNLRVATYSLQAHNCIRKTKSVLNSKCIHLSSGGFELKFMGKYIDKYFYEEDAMRRYNEEAFKQFGENALLFDIPDTKTTAFDYFSNITLEFLERISTVEDVKEIFRTKNNWKSKCNVKLHLINLDNYEDYKKLAIRCLNEDIENNNVANAQDIKNKYSLEYIENLKQYSGVKKLQQVFRDRFDWRRLYSVSLHHIRFENFEYYKQIAIKAKKDELESGKQINSNCVILKIKPTQQVLSQENKIQKIPITNTISRPKLIIVK